MMLMVAVQVGTEVYFGYYFESGFKRSEKKPVRKFESVDSAWSCAVRFNKKQGIANNPAYSNVQPNGQLLRPQDPGVAGAPG